MPCYRLNEFSTPDTGAMRPVALCQRPATFLAQDGTHCGPTEASSARDCTDRNHIVDPLKFTIGTHDTRCCGIAVPLAVTLHWVVGDVLRPSSAHSFPFRGGDFRVGSLGTELVPRATYPSIRTRRCVRSCSTSGRDQSPLRVS